MTFRMECPLKPQQIIKKNHPKIRELFRLQECNIGTILNRTASMRDELQRLQTNWTKSDESIALMGCLTIISLIVSMVTCGFVIGIYCSH